MARKKERTIMNKKALKSLSIILCLGLSVVFFTQLYGDMFPITTAQQAGVNKVALTLLTTGKPSVLRVTVTKVELWNGSAWVTIFSGSSQLDLVGTGTFPGISDLDLPDGTYSRLRVTFTNSFPVSGSLAHSGTTYYTTATTINSDAGLVATTTIGLWAEGIIKNPNWGNLGDPVVQEYDIAPFTVTNATNYQPTLKFSVDNSLELYQIGATYYFILNNPTVSIV